MCVSRKVLFGKNGEHQFNGFMPIEKHDFMETIKENKKFLLRHKPGYFQPIAAEQDPSQKQIVPYLVFRYKKKIFMFKRIGGGNEPRLYNLYSIGTGGHIDPPDNKADADVIEESIKRELAEELDLGGTYKKRLIGFINDDTDDVGKVHFGLLYLVDLKSPKISITKREKHVNEGSLVKIEEVDSHKEFMETWSQIAFDALRNF